MVLNEYGKIIEEEIIKTEELRKEIKIDCFIIMPNHIHLLIVINNDDKFNTNMVGTAGLLSEMNDNNKNFNGTATCGPYEGGGNDITKNILSNSVQGIKSICTSKIRKKLNDYEFSWQRSFYDVIIKNDDQLFKTRQYIKDNPKKWWQDVNNPDN